MRGREGVWWALAGVPATVALLLVVGVGGGQAESLYDATAAEILRVLNAGYIDPTFGPFDWQSVFDQYQDAIACARSDAEFADVMYQVLVEPNVSHLMYLPAEPEPRYARAFLDGGIGVDVRILGGKAVLTRVAAGSPAADAGLQVGWEVLQIDGVPLAEIQSESSSLPRPPLSERKQRADLAIDVLLRTYGDPGVPVAIMLGTPDGVRDLVIPRAPRQGRSVLVEGVPPAFLECEALWLAAGIGYIRFNSFDPALLVQLMEAIDGLSDAPGLILDLRGNSGGFFEVRKALADRLVGRRQLLWLDQYKGRSEMVYADAVPNAYRGRLVVLVDELSASAAEATAGALQAIGRATVIGSPTQGSVLVADWAILPNGATLVLPVAVTRVYGGAILEGAGVAPDIEVPLDPLALLRGVDSQLEAAVRILASE